MISEDGEWIICELSTQGCESKIRNHKHGRLHHGANWVFTKAVVNVRERAWCPNHIPNWYDHWNRRNEGIDPQYQKPKRKARGL